MRTPFLLESKLIDHQRAEQIHFNLRQKTSAGNIAFVEHNNFIYWSQDYYQKIPFSPVVILLQNLFDQWIDQSFFILRNRVYYSGEFNYMDLGMLKVVAKRGTDKVVAKNHNMNLEKLSFVEICFTTLNPMKFLGMNEINKNLVLNSEFELELNLEKLVSLNLSTIARHDQDRQIAAVLVDRNNKILSMGINSNSKNKTLHAEVVMLQKYYYQYKELLPVGSKIFSSHKPCKMCAGMIYELAQTKEKPFVFYEKLMTGSMNTLGVLDEKKLSIQVPGLIETPIYQLMFESYN